MRKIISKKAGGVRAPAEEPAEGLVFVQLRLPEDMAKKLRESGESAGRKLPAEILYRLKSGQAETDDLGLYGWLNPNRDMLLGKAVGILAGQIEEAAGEPGDFAAEGEGLMGSAQYRSRALAMIGVAIKEVLLALGANDESMSADNRAHASLFARQMSSVMRWVGVKSPPELSPDKALVAELGKAWGVQPEKREDRT